MNEDLVRAFRIIAVAAAVLLYSILVWWLGGVMASPVQPAEIYVDADFPPAFQPLFKPARYKVFYGGRGGAKSWAFARALLLRGMEAGPIRWLCARETQRSIKDSVHQLLRDQIGELHLGQFYKVQAHRIIGLNGTEFTFAGLRLNIDNIKSLESYDGVWVEEARNLSQASLNKLIPTIRKTGSELWFSFNPELEDDPVFKYFVRNTPPPEAVVVKVNWRQNPWFPEVLLKEMKHLRETDPVLCDHIYEGACVSMVEGAIYAQQLTEADASGRISRVPYDATRPVHTFWDLGVDDATAIWFVQEFPFEHRVIDYLESTGKGLPWYLKELQARPYIYGTDYLPHDGRARQLGTGKSVEELMRLAGRRVAIVPRLAVSDGINAARTIFGQCFFDGVKCEEGLHALRNYHYDIIEELGVRTKKPVHDWSSHGADAFRTFAVGIRPVKRDPPRGQQERPARVSVWS